MLDIQYIRDNPKQVAEHAKRKNYDVDIQKLLKLDEERRSLVADIDSIRADRNELASQSKDGKPTSEQISRGQDLKRQLASMEKLFETTDAEYTTLLKAVPNIASDDTPVGASEDENKVVYEWGDKPSFSFEVRNHWEIAEHNNWIDKERAAKVAGARFAYIKGPLVELQFALQQFTLQQLINQDTLASIMKEFEVEGSGKIFTPVIPPHMIRTEVFDAMDRLEPREDRYKIEDEDLWLQGSAEHVLGSMHMNEMIDTNDLPLRYLGYATSFRREAGTYGKDLEGIIRMHQFDKLEMEILSLPEQGMNEHLLTIAIQEHLLRALEIPYRKLLKCTADIGKPNFRGVDMDAWLPGQNQWRETHTADYMTDYQTRRLKTRSKLADGTTVLLHTIDATAFALGRAMVAIIENNQNEDYSVTIPKVLQPYMSKREVL